MANVNIRLVFMILIPLLIFLGFSIIYFYLKRREKELLEDIQNSNNRRNLVEEDDIDIKEIINTLKADLNEKSIENTISVLNEKQYSVYSDNSIINSLINSKIQICNSKNIKVDSDVVEMPDNIKISETVALIGNLFDNAIEACEACAMKGMDTFINIKYTKAAGVWMLTIINSKVVDEKPVKTKFRTTKADKKNHGFGMKIIQRIVHKNNGILKINDGGNQIEISVSI